LLGNAFTYTYDNAGQLATLEMPGGVREVFGYDGAGRVTADTIRTALNQLLRATEFTYGDARGKVTRAWNAVFKRDSLTATYSGLGFVVASSYRDIGTDWRGFTQNFSSAEKFGYDALGNILASTTATLNSTAADEHTHTSSGRTYTYDPVSGRLAQMAGDPRPDNLVYDANGNVRFQYTQTPPFTSPIREDRMSYFAADGTLRATDHRTRVRDNQSFTFTFEEYWYDALGRRVLVRTRRDCSPSDYDLESCSISTVRRTIWDGVKELFEIQMPDTTVVALVENDTAALPNLGATINAEPMARNPFYGRVAYTNGPGLDQPLSVTRWGYADTAFVGSAAQQRFEQWNEPFTIVPHWNMRGQADHGTTATGDGATCGGGTPPGGGASSGRCALVYWPYGWTASWQKTYRQPSWNGSLLDQKRDGSQLIYKRNRYYDPATGRFTQEDPIGLAGGLNLYGFAGGDPVNFSDPFGLYEIRVYGEHARRAVEELSAEGPAKIIGCRVVNRLTNQRQLALRLRVGDGGAERRRVSRMASTSLRTARWSAGGSSSTRRRRSRFSGESRIARSVPRLNSTAPYNTHAWPPISRLLTWCERSVEGTLRIGFGVKRAT
jgi:RHS repeat-associated protein